jgi:NADH:ubiquinone oxidoreductase subunit 3 (subunit A)
MVVVMIVIVVVIGIGIVVVVVVVVMGKDSREEKLDSYRITFLVYGRACIYLYRRGERPFGSRKL